MPGFRKASAAPPQLLINTVGPDKFRNAVAEHLLQATLEEAMAPIAANAFNDSLKLLTSVGVIAKAYVGLNCEPKARAALRRCCAPKVAPPC